MNGPIPPTEEIKKIDPKVELEIAKIHLANIRYALQMKEVIVAKLEELAK